jgi:enoyl-CoA hydratase
MNYDRYELVRVAQDGRILKCRLDRPDALNAINSQLHRELEDLFEQIAVDTSVDVVTLTGNGRAFCAGGDIREMLEGWLTLENRDKGAPGEFTRGAARMIKNIVNLPQVIIASVNGPAMGLGANIALMCDIVLASENARFADPHVKVGLVAGDGGPIIWPLLIGLNKAKEFLFTGDPLTAAEAERIGLVNHVYPAADLEAETDAFARRIAAGATRAIQWTKLTANKILWERVNLMMETALGYEALSGATLDHREAIAAFKERREPRFNGR